MALFKDLSITLKQLIRSFFSPREREICRLSGAKLTMVRGSVSVLTKHREYKTVAFAPLLLSYTTLDVILKSPQNQTIQTLKTLAKMEQFSLTFLSKLAFIDETACGSDVVTSSPARF